ncbi:MAG: 2-amino-4-hydroxy-6-hydroxymethyldihydropteridine diphosphokinase [Polyangiaceae bacterium]
MRVVVGLGSNLGEREATLRRAIAKLRDLAPVEAISRVYATAPIGPPQPDYLNAAVLLLWEKPLRALLAALLRIEADAGRVRRERWQARTLDLDILWTDGPPVAEAELTVPHARLHERAFAVLPLLDVAPDAPYSAAAVADQRIEATTIALD